MTLDRRDLIKVTSGGVFGALLTPLPWKLLDDSANWSQNWPGVPKVPRGEVTTKHSVCTLCPAGCGVKAECVAGCAFAVEGAAAHPVSKGVLCPVGLGAHTAAWHPRRIRQGAGYSEILKRIPQGARIAILDLGPERAVSAAYRQAYLYARLPDRQEGTLNALARRIGRPPGSLGIDLERTRTLISFGAPVLEGWAVPGLLMARWRTGELNIVQVEPRQSRTALAATSWIPVEPGGEAAFAAKIAAGEFKIDGPAVAIGNGGSEEDSIAALNIVMGAVGTTIVPRDPLPWKQEPAQDFSSLADHSIDVLFVDSSRASSVTPWPVIRRKVAKAGIVIAMSYREDAVTRHADFVLPVAAPFETLEDSRTAPCAHVHSFAIALPLIDAPLTKQTGIDHVAALSGKALPGVEEIVKLRVSEIHAAKRGVVTSYADGTSTKVSDIASAEDLWKKSASGACWLGETSKAKLTAPKTEMPPASPVIARDSRFALTLLIHDSPDASLPLMTKLYQESGLYAPAALARINPVTARAKTGTRVIVETAHGEVIRELLNDPAVMPGVIEVTVAPDIADIATDGSFGDWRTVAASVRRA